MGAKTRRIPSLGKERREFYHIEMDHGDDGYGDGGQRHDGILGDIGPHDAQHSPHQGIKNGKKGEQDAPHMRHIGIRNESQGGENGLQGQEDLDELAHADETVGQHAQAYQDGKNDDDPMGGHGSPVFSKTEADPLGSCGAFRPA